MANIRYKTFVAFKIRDVTMRAEPVNDVTRKISSEIIGFPSLWPRLTVTVLKVDRSYNVRVWRDRWSCDCAVSCWSAASCFDAQSHPVCLVFCLWHLWQHRSGVKPSHRVINRRQRLKTDDESPLPLRHHELVFLHFQLWNSFFKIIAVENFHSFWSRNSE